MAEGTIVFGTNIGGWAGFVSWMGSNREASVGSLEMDFRALQWFRCLLRPFRFLRTFLQKLQVT